MSEQVKTGTTVDIKTANQTGLTIRIGHLYPTLMSVAADRGNLFSDRASQPLAWDRY